MTEAASPTDGGKRSRDKGLIVTVALCSAALVAAVVMAVLWTVATVQSDSAANAVASDRNAAADAAGEAAVALTTVSMDDIDKSLDGMHDVTTGELAQQFAQGPARDDLSAALKETGVSMRTDLNSAVLTSFDDEKETASALAFVVRTQTLPDGQDRVMRQGIGMSLVKQDGAWKVSDFDTRFAGVGDAEGNNTGAEDVPAQPAPADPGAGAPAPGGDGTGDTGGPAQGSGQQNPAGS
ncbi:hypothetical protein [Tomitella fengzijianii]|uniref:Mce-associated membrane protein n=1 Tax=Tomitella fengzijianii TaxID=2597660 RepID=A0A516X0H5_9ACTN|nr:hypothetical protein [Tomitella fengzijianii]QDQ96553.1 hypothetical protein FO059_03405 [Tomitella fengzijianii]